MTSWWQDPEVEDRLAVLYVNATYLLLGLYGWEYLQSFDVEYTVIRGRLPFRWVLVPYMAGRIFLLCGLLFLVVEMSPSLGSFACQAGITSISVSVDIAIGTSSINFMIRTWVIWKNSRVIHFLLLLLTLGQWTMLAIDVKNVKAFTSNGVCVMYITHPAVCAAVYVYTMCYDLLVLVLSITKLSKQPSNCPLKERLRAQGLLYFGVAALANILPTVFALLGSDAMVGIFANVAVTASTIASCRAVRSLLGLSKPDPSHTLDENAEFDNTLTTQFPNQTLIASTGIC